MASNQPRDDAATAPGATTSNFHPSRHPSQQHSSRVTGRSPPPPTRDARSGGIIGGGRPSIGDSSGVFHDGSMSGQYGNGRRSTGGSGSALRGARLSYGASVAGSNTTPSVDNNLHNVESRISPASDSSMSNNAAHHANSASASFLAALSPATAKYLAKRGDHGVTSLRGAADVPKAGTKGAGHDNNDKDEESEDDIMNARMGGSPSNNNNNNNNNTGGNGDDNNQHQHVIQHLKQKYNSHLIQIGQDDETIQLRSFVQSLLGMKLPITNVNDNDKNNDNNRCQLPTMTTPDPTTAGFYALALLAKTNGRRPDDAYLAARAMSLKGEGKRAIWIMDRAGLIGVEAASINGEKSAWGEDGEGDVGGGVGEFGLGGDEYEADDNEPIDSGLLGSVDFHYNFKPHISNEMGVRNALLLRTEAALLAGQCLVKAGEQERAIAVYEEAMRFPPLPPPVEWGYFGYGYRLNDGEQCVEEEVGQEDDGGLNARLGDEMYVRQWREQSLAHTALIDEGHDERLLRLAENIRMLPFSSNDDPTATVNLVMESIHPMSRLCAARGIAYDEISNPHRALPFLRMALTIDARCIEAFDYVVRRRLLNPEEEREWVSSLNWGGQEGTLGAMGISWLRDAYLARVSGGMGGNVLPPSTIQAETKAEEELNRSSIDYSLVGGRILDASSVHEVGLQTPALLSLASPDFVGAAWKDGKVTASRRNLVGSESHTIDEAFKNLAATHNLGKSSDVLALAAIRAYGSHNLRTALAYCTVIDTLDPFCRAAGYVHVATLVGLGLKRRLFQLAHRLVDADPKDSLAWFAVGSYYHLCRRYDLAQRHFSRSTRLDPSSAECWIGFGCSFAVCDESDQALASFRAAQNKYSGSHIPLLYMGMEYLRTNHLSLAGHFLHSAQKTDASDPLCCNELGVWSFRRGDMKDASFWFVKALRLHIEAESSILTSSDEALGMDGFALLNKHAANGSTAQEQTIREETVATETPLVKHLPGSEPPMSNVICAVKTPSGQSIAASTLLNVTFNSSLSDAECIDRCKDVFWEPTIYNLGQSYRKLKQFSDAILCFEKCVSLNPGNAAAYAALGFARHLSGDIDSAIDSYHEALSRKPDDPFSSEMLNRALAEAVTYPKSSVFASSYFDIEHQTSAIGSSILANIAKATYSQGVIPGQSVMTSNDMDIAIG
eukprot:scaffold5469_cov175-Alexandrium_tamarense.AAC.11